MSLNNARQFATITHIIPWEETLALETHPSQTQLLPRQSVVVLGGPGLGETVIPWSTPGRMWVYNPQPELSELEDSRPVNQGVFAHIKASHISIAMAIKTGVGSRQSSELKRLQEV